MTSDDSTGQFPQIAFWMRSMAPDGRDPASRDRAALSTSSGESPRPNGTTAFQYSLFISSPKRSTKSHVLRSKGRLVRKHADCRGGQSERGTVVTQSQESAS